MIILLFLFGWQVHARADYITVRHEVMAEMDDGINLNTTVFEPIGPAPEAGWPAIVLIHSLGSSKNVEGADAFSRSGYLTLTYTVRGQGREQGGAPSGGTSTLMGPREAKDLEAMIAWLKTHYAVDPDRIGIVGASQGGIHTWMAVAGKLGVAAAVPQSASAGMADVMIMNGSIHSRLIALTRKGVLDSAQVAGSSAMILAYDAEGLRRAFAEPRDLRPGLSGADIPVMIQYAWEDGWGAANNVITDFNLLKGPKKLYLGTGGHGSAKVPSEISFCSRWTQGWFDRWLKGEQNGIENEPPVEIALLDTWEHFELPTFPPPDARNQTLYLHAVADTTDALFPLPPAADTVQILTHAAAPDSVPDSLYRANPFLRGPGDVFTRFSLDALLYETPPLEADMLLIGIPGFHLFAGGTALRYQVNLRLWDIDPQAGTKRLFSRATYLVDGETHQEGEAISADMAAIGYRIPAGHRIRLEISNLDLDWDRVKQDWWRLWGLPYPEQGEIRIYSGPDHLSRVDLPVFGAQNDE